MPEDGKADDLKIDYDKVASLPAIIRGFCYSNDGWIVGSGAAFILGIVEKPRDWDILIPFYKWGQACRHIPEGSHTNSHGGVKVKIFDNLYADVWAGDIGWFMAQVPDHPSYAIQPKTMTMLKSSKQTKRTKK